MDVNKSIHYIMSTLLASPIIAKQTSLVALQRDSISALIYVLAVEQKIYANENQLRKKVNDIHLIPLMGSVQLIPR